MGRGRQKAKHTKVARELKYFSPDTNYNALERELTSHPGSPAGGASVSAASTNDDRLDEDLAKWPEYEASSYDSDDYETEDEPKRA